jgi:hypothetical protein
LGWTIRVNFIYNDEALKIIGLKSEEVMGKLVTTLSDK